MVIVHFKNQNGVKLCFTSDYNRTVQKTKIVREITNEGNLDETMESGRKKLSYLLPQRTILRLSVMRNVIKRSKLIVLINVQSLIVLRALITKTNVFFHISDSGNFQSGEVIVDEEDILDWDAPVKKKLFKKSPIVQF